jgi:hypothetical protein
MMPGARLRIVYFEPARGPVPGGRSNSRISRNPC